MSEPLIVPGTKDVPYAHGGDLNFGLFLCRILGVRKHFLTRAKGYYITSNKRYYHNFAHALDVAAEVILAGYDVFIEHPRELILAAIYHDAIYQVGAKNNETQSAEVARQEMKEFEMYDIDHEVVERLIWLTSRHFTDVGLTDEEAIFMDADIHGFAAPWEIFTTHQSNLLCETLAIKSHTTAVQDHHKFLASLLERPNIFYSERYRDLHEDAARANITRYLKEDAAQ